MKDDDSDHHGEDPMHLISIDNVLIFNGTEVESRSKLTFHASPGNIVDTDHAANTIIDGTGFTLIPGLIDAKVDADAILGSFRKFALAGITTIIDSSSGTAESTLMRSASADAPGWPSYVASGSAIAGETYSDLAALTNRRVQMISSQVEAEEIIAGRTAGGGGASNLDFVKLIADLPGLDDQLLRSVVDTAHRHGKLVVAHASSVASYRRAVIAGCEIVTPVPFDGELDADTIRMLVDRGTVVIPTLTLLRHVLDAAAADHPPSAFATAVANVGRLHAAGVPICAGTAANERQDGVSVEFGQSLHDELRLLVQAGLSNMEALRSATSVPSRAFRLPDRGTMAVGTRSDLVLVMGNPLENIAAAARVHRVWIVGIEFDMENDEMLMHE